MPVVRFEGVSVRYGNGPDILKDIHLRLRPGSFHYLVGESGAGKSTLLRLTYLAQRPTIGDITLFGRTVGQLPRKELPGLRRRIGVVFQDFRLLPHLTAMDNVALPLRIAGAREALVQEHVPELLDWVGLGEHLDALPPTLSGGQQQRVAIARAVITRPSLLIADEPTGNVDDRIALRLLHLFRELNRMGTTVLLATHNEALASRMPAPTLKLEDGRLSEVPVEGAA